VYLQRLLQINMATLAASGALLLGMGRRSPALPLLVLLAAMASIWLTDVTGWVRLNRTVGNLAALVAAAVTLRGLYLHGELDVSSIANMLICLQLILLFEEKDNRVYWLIAGLSLLHVVAATAFSQGVWFGLLVMVYMLVGLSALALLVLYRPWHAPRPGVQPPPPGAAAARRWPLAGQVASFTTTPGGPARAGIGREFFTRLGGIGLGTLGLAILLFLALPRLGVTAWRGTLPNPTHVVGFSDQVTLGELGEIIQGNDEVMRIRFFEEARSPYPVNGEIYLHGATLLEYSQGRWKTQPAARGEGPPPLEKAPRLPATGWVRQKCELEPLDREELFYVMPVVPTQSDARICVEPDRGRLSRRGSSRDRRFIYELGTTALVGGVQQPLVPNVQIAATGDELPLPSSDVPQDLPSLTALANRWIAESGLPPEDRVGRARYLEQKLAASGQFEYSLQGQPRDPSLDPVEDFVTNNPRGHCEYFATALTLMLRSQNISARMVVGYKCDELNELGQFYQVRQSHAHTWVEAYLPFDQIPPELLHGQGYWPWESAGGWLRLDPTPAGAAEARGTFAVLMERLKKGVDRLETLWSNYVLEMERERQQEAIYRPVVHAIRHLVRSLGNPQWWRGVAETMGRILSVGQGGLAPWMRLILILLLGLLAVGLGLWRLGRLASRLSPWLVRWATPAARSSRSHIEFYRRLEVLLARQGLVRAAGETQQEFATVAGAKLASATGRPSLAQLPSRVVAAFYRVRFGRLPLDSSQAAAVEHALAELVDCCYRPKGFVPVAGKGSGIRD
jgi:transglutaminase-like putative cysteine protease